LSSLHSLVSEDISVSYGQIRRCGIVPVRLATRNLLKAWVMGTGVKVARKTMTNAI